MTNVSALPGSVEKALPNQTGFDASSGILATVATTLASILGYKFAIRYISRGPTEDPGDLSHDEAVSILNSGLALMAIQHVEPAGWHPSAALGTQYGQTAAAHAAEIGFPANVNVWLDLEGVAEGTPAQNVIDYCNNWFDAVSANDFVPGVYIGANSGLNADQLSNLKFAHFWKSSSTVPPVPGRGYQLIQTGMINAAGISIDPDTTQNDEKGDAVQWLRVQ
ncbi:MAG: DUF1906 domain-containing protein [Pseudonocardiaceae bacterium]